MQIKEDFKAGVKSFFRLIHLAITLALLCLLLNEYFTIASNDIMRVVDIKTPFFSTQFLQEIK